MAWKKKKKKETAEELKARLKELEESAEEEDQEEEKDQEEDEGLPEAQQQEIKKKNKSIGLRSPMPKGEFSLDITEMALFAQLAVSSEEYKVFHQWLIGQKLDKIVTEYNKAVGEKSEEELPTE